MDHSYSIGTLGLNTNLAEGYIDSTLKEWSSERTKNRDSTKNEVHIGKGLFKGSMWFNILPNMEYVLAR